MNIKYWMSKKVYIVRSPLTSHINKLEPDLERLLNKGLKSY